MDTILNRHKYRLGIFHLNHIFILTKLLSSITCFPPKCISKVGIWESPRIQGSRQRIDIFTKDNTHADSSKAPLLNDCQNIGSNKEDMEESLRRWFINTCKMPPAIIEWNFRRNWMSCTVKVSSKWLKFKMSLLMVFLVRSHYWLQYTPIKSHYYIFATNLPFF